MASLIFLCEILFIFLYISKVHNQQATGGMPIKIKDKGIEELKKNQVAMIFYVTVTNTGKDPVHLSINGQKCCQTITKDDVDCLSMKLFGGDMGELFPQDTRNLTLAYINLLPHNRVGYCDVLIREINTGRSMVQTIKFDTTLVRGDKVNVPRLLQNYYDYTNYIRCDSVDRDPLNLCKPYNCFIRYDGERNRWNSTSQRCEKIPVCMGDNVDDLVAYNPASNKCVRIKKAISHEELQELKKGKPSVRTLEHNHGYPLNFECYNGKLDETGHKCICKDGWTSAPFEQKYFNPDLQVYHMCTVWTGTLTAEEARNITNTPPPYYLTTNIVIFSFLGFALFSTILVFAYLVYRIHFKGKVKTPPIAMSELQHLSKSSDDDE